MVKWSNKSVCLTIDHWWTTTKGKLSFDHHPLKERSQGDARGNLRVSNHVILKDRDWAGFHELPAVLKGLGLTARLH